MRKTSDIQVLEAASQIVHLCETQRTGTIFIMTHKGRIAQIKLTKGDIVDIRFGTAQGIKALEGILVTRHFKQFSFRARAASAMKFKVDTQLPAQSRLLEIFKGVSGDVGVDLGRGNNRGSVQSADITQAIGIVIAELTLYLGPIAALICDGKFDGAKSVTDILSVSDEVASEIASMVDRAKFKRVVQGELSKL